VKYFIVPSMPTLSGSPAASSRYLSNSLVSVVLVAEEPVAPPPPL
jgi:hypothetical protein